MINVRDFGAVGDGVVLDSPAIQAAINAAKEQGGGTVTVPAGRYRCGTLVLASHLELNLQAGAVIQGSHDIADYIYDETKKTAGKDHHKRHLVAAHDCDYVSITGRGMIDGQGPAFWATGK